MRIVSFGCSLTRQGSDNLEFPNHHGLRDKDSGVIRTLAKLNNCEYLNYAISSTGHQKQNTRFSEYMLSEYKPDDVIIWQFTGYNRFYYDFILPKDVSKDKYEWDFENFTTKDYYVNNVEKIDLYNEYYSVSLLSHCETLFELEYFHPNIRGTKLPNMTYAEWNGLPHLVDTLANIKMIKNMGNPILCWFGWYNALISPGGKSCDYNPRVENHLREISVPFVNDRYLEWTMRNNYIRTDSMHPCPTNTAPIYAKEVLYPKLKEILK